MGTSKKQKVLRPTTGKVREALFDIIRSKMNNARFLDLYAGTGAVGIDAMKEGALEVLFVEESKSLSRQLDATIKKLHFSEKARIVTKKVLSFIDWAGLNRITFDIIFLDPPYHTDEIIHALSAIDKSAILSHNGVVIAEHFAKRKLPEMFGSLKKVKDYYYGDSVLSFYHVSS